jgi:hypothetical protein
MHETEFFIRLQRRIAQTAVGASAIRNQGKKGDIGLIKSCRDYFENELNIEEFFTLLSSETLFKGFLDRHTTALTDKFPETAKSWGAARKGLNLFLRDLTYNKYIADRYNLPTEFIENNEKLKNLEVPLDKDVAMGLHAHFTTQLPKWTGIKHLQPKDSEIYQEKAKELANERSIARIHLDLEFWRDKR